MHPVTILTLVLGAIMLITMPMAILAVRSVVAGRTHRGGMVGIRVPETTASDEAWLAGHQAAYALRWKVLLLEVVPVVAGILLSVWWPWVGLVVVLLGLPATIAGSMWMSRTARTAAAAAAPGSSPRAADAAAL